MRNNFRPFSIKNTLILSIALIHALMMTVFVFDLTQRQKTFLLEESFQTTQAITETLAINATPWVLSNDLAGLEEIIQAQSQQIHINFALLTNTAGEVLAYYHRNAEKQNKIGQFIKVAALSPFDKTPPLHVNYDNSDVVDISVPIMLDGTHLGWSRVQMSRQHIETSVQTITWEGIIYAVIAIIIGSIAALMMGNTLTRRIYKLVATTQEIRSGKRQFTIESGRNDELSDLEHNFNEMLHTLTNSEQMLSRAKEEAEITLKSIGDAVIVVKPDGTVKYLNPIAEVLTGSYRENATGHHIDDVMHIFYDDDKKPIENPVFRALREGEPVSLFNQATLISRHGETYSIENSAAPIIDPIGTIIGAVIVFHDATEQRALQKQLHWQATHDSLTQLHNRQAFEDQLDTLIANSAQHPDSQNAMIYLDLDQFKVVNDTAGHTAGDQLLKQITQLIQQALSKEAFLARIGGDEFGILLCDSTLEDAQNVAQTLLQTITKQRFFWENKAFDIGASMGIAAINGSLDKTTIFSRADIACYIAKDKGRNRIQPYIESSEDLDQSQQILNRIRELKDAIHEKRLTLFAQEVTPLQQQQEQLHFEVLVRMLSQDGEILPPGQFLPAAERFNIMPDIDSYVIQQSFAWLQHHYQAVSLMNINISGQSLVDPKFNQNLIELLEQNRHLSNKICFEITETIAIYQMSETVKFLHQIKTYGAQLALDDFGSGFSSFNWLKNLPVDYVKIDGHFIKDVLTDPVDASMVQAIKEISDTIGIQTIAEFVENQAISQWLLETGIDYAQGYYFSQPKPIDQLLTKA